jgi:hypothetical protein
MNSVRAAVAQDCTSECCDPAIYLLRALGRLTATALAGPAVCASARVGVVACIVCPVFVGTWGSLVLQV